MSDGRDQAERALAQIERPDDPAEEKTLEPDLPPDRTKQFRNTSFSRMRRSWVGDDAVALADIEYAAEQAIDNMFRRALRLIEQLQYIAQIPITVGDEIQHHPNGTRKVRLDEYGDPVEDWTRLSRADCTNFLFILTTHMYEWESQAVRLWGEAMFAKGIWEQMFSYGFRVLPGAAISGKPTIDDRTQMGHAHSADDRFFGIFCSALSRKADALVRNLNRIQRLLEKTLEA